MTRSRLKIDLHTHTHFSGDSTTTIDEFITAFNASGLDAVAVTDHLVIDGALSLREILGDRVIIGQEFRVREGELIGLYLQEKIPPLLNAAEAARRIRAQGGLVYVPHPGDTRRTSVSLSMVDKLASEMVIDIVEVANSKVSDPNLLEAVKSVAVLHGLGLGAGSDSHVPESLGSSFAEVEACSSAEELLASLKSDPWICWNYFDPPRSFKRRIVPSVGKPDERATPQAHRGVPPS